MVTVLICGVGLSAHAAPLQFQVDPETLSEQLFSAQVQVREGGKPGLVRLVLSAELVEWRRRNPTASSTDVALHLSGVQQRLTAALLPSDAMRSESDYALKLVSLLVQDTQSAAATSPQLRLLVDRTLGASLSTFDTREDLVNGSLRMTSWLSARSEVELAVWTAVRRLAALDATFALRWNESLGQPVNLNATATLAQLKADPQLLVHVDIDALLAQQTSQAAFLQEIRRQFELVAAALAAESEQARARLVALTSICPVSTTPSCTPEQRAAAAATAQAEQKEIDAAAVAAKLLGGLARIADLKAGEKIEKVATAWFSIITAINKFDTAIDGLSVAGALSSGASLVLAGNILGAVMSLVGLLGDSGPSLDQQILEQVLALRQEVRALHEEMRARFDIIGQSLNVIFTTMLNEFDRLNVAIAGNTAALIDVQNQLAEQELRLETVAATILTAIGDVELHDTRVAVNRYIGHVENYGVPIPTYGVYTGPENEFHYAATGVATHTAFVVSPALATDPAVSPTNILNNYGESNALSYLARLGSLRDARVPASTNVFANPSVWNFSAQAYALLALQNPGYASQVNPSRTAQIGLEGLRILDVASSFSRPAFPDRAGNRTNPIFKSLIADYRAALERFGNSLSAIRVQEIEKRQEPLDSSGASYLSIPKDYGVFSTASQAIPESTLPVDRTTLSKCTPTSWNPQLSRPSNVTYKTLPTELRFAHYAYSPVAASTNTSMLPELFQCYDIAWVNPRTVTTSTSSSEYARLRLSIHTRFRWATGPALPIHADKVWVNARTATYTWPEIRVSYECWNPHIPNCSNPEPPVELEQALIERWPRDRALFEQSATLSNDATLLGVARTRMTAFLQGRQREYFSKAVSALVNANTPLNVAAADMTRAARQLQAFTRLGFPVALSSDDLLSGLLFGQRSVPVDMVLSPQLSNTFVTALNAYACTPVSTVGKPCEGGVFHPLVDQPHLDTRRPKPPTTTPMVCRLSTANLPGVTGDDPVGDCMIAGAYDRLGALSERYMHYSQLLHDGTYVEELPWIASTLDTLPLVDTLTRTSVSP
ncbi:hypothetical protein [Myxococcus qinghaiensis]|uniref:hypothetical protein n=1 Tax=Myxococcus qinghaiensis TaxID=2906758 RepID=UPI0020A77BB8|nr:hypothetical protein [Myxococcus qinghaiensis]MCP3170217.1 hypothetical protein [Myxococcus qinghaiensis]